MRLSFSYSFDQRKGKRILYRKFIKTHMKNSSKRKRVQNNGTLFLIFTFPKKLPNSFSHWAIHARECCRPPYSLSFHLAVFSPSVKMPSSRAPSLVIAARDLLFNSSVLNSTRFICHFSKACCNSRYLHSVLMAVRHLSG